MKVKFGHYELRVYLGILSEDMPKAFWFSSVYDLDDDAMLGIGEPKETKREALEEGKKILAGWALPCDVGCCGSCVDEPEDCDNCPIGKAWDDFENKIEEEKKK